DFAARRGLQLAYRTEMTRGLMVKPAPAGLKPEEELRLLLKGTGLEVEKINNSTVTIRRAAPPAAAIAAGGGFQLARAELPAAQETRNAAAAAGDKPAESSRAAEDDSRGTPEILVKGKRSLNTDIERTEDAPQPYVVFSSEDIERSQALNIED